MNENEEVNEFEKIYKNNLLTLNLFFIFLLFFFILFFSYFSSNFLGTKHCLRILISSFETYDFGFDFSFQIKQKVVPKKWWI